MNSSGASGKGFGRFPSVSKTCALTASTCDDAGRSVAYNIAPVRHRKISDDGLAFIHFLLWTERSYVGTRIKRCRRGVIGKLLRVAYHALCSYFLGSRFHHLWLPCLILGIVAVDSVLGPSTTTLVFKVGYRTVRIQNPPKYGSLCTCYGVRFTGRNARTTRGAGILQLG